MRTAQHLLLLLALASPVHAADTDLDPAFGGTPFPGTLTVAFDKAGSSFDDRGLASVATAQGLVIAGAVASGTGGTDIGVIRVTYGGQLDTTFGTGGRTLVPIDIVAGGVDRPNTISTDPVGRFVIGAGASNGNGVSPVLVRLTANGVLDTSFALDGKRVLEEEVNFRGTGAFAVAGADSSVYYAAVVQRNVLGSSPSFYVSRLPASGLGGPQFGQAGRTYIDFPGKVATSVNAITLQGSLLLMCGGVIDDSSARWAYAAVSASGGTATGVAIAASETNTPNAGDHVCNSIAPSRFDAARIYLGGGGMVGGKNGVVVAAVDYAGGVDRTFSGDGFARFLVSGNETYATLDEVIERASGRIAVAGSVDRPGTGTDAFLAVLKNDGVIESGGLTVYELLEDSRQSRITDLAERDGSLILTGLLQYGPSDPGDFDFLAMKTVPGTAIFGHGFE